MSGMPFDVGEFAEEFVTFGKSIKVPKYGSITVEESLAILAMQGQELTNDMAVVKLVTLFLSIRLGADWTEQVVSRIPGAKLREMFDFFQGELTQWGAKPLVEEEEDSDPKEQTGAQSIGDSELGIPLTIDSTPNDLESNQSGSSDKPLESLSREMSEQPVWSAMPSATSV